MQMHVQNWIGAESTAALFAGRVCSNAVRSTARGKTGCLEFVRAKACAHQWTLLAVRRATQQAAIPDQAVHVSSQIGQGEEDGRYFLHPCTQEVSLSVSQQQLCRTQRSAVGSRGTRTSDQACAMSHTC